MAARSSLTVEDRISIVILMLSPTRQYGDATALAETYGVSRQDLYYLRDQGRPALEAALTPHSGPVATGVTLIVTPERLARNDQDKLGADQIQQPSRSVADLG